MISGFFQSPIKGKKEKKRQIRLPVYYGLSSNSVSHENPHKENAQVHTVSMIVLHKINKDSL